MVHWEEFSDYLMGFYLKKTNHRETAEDLRQEALLQIWENFDTVKAEEKRSAWMWSIAHNLVKKHYKKNEQQTLKMAPSSDSSEQRQLIEFAENCLREFIADLPLDYRETVIRAEILGEKYASIADSLQLSESAIKSRVVRARAIIKKDFAKCCGFTLNEKRQWKSDNWENCFESDC